MASCEHFANISSKYFLMSTTGHLGFLLFCSGVTSISTTVSIVDLRYIRWQNIENLIHNNLFQGHSELRCAYEGKPFEDLDSA